jgi:DNA polymerase-1
MTELSSSNFMVRQSAERASQNMPMQGSASDIIKLAMLRIEEALERGGFKARLIMQVHDELIIDADENEIEEVKTILQEEMEKAMALNVPLVAEAVVGENWAEL